jgi:hypothetical protein
MFGHRITPAPSDASANWIREACRSSDWTVGAIVPNDYASYLRVMAPPPSDGDWWADYRRLFEAIASSGAQHTSNPDRAWFAIWEGHGFDTTASMRLLPRLEMPGRSYYVLGGAVAAVTEVRYPDSGTWRNPDLFWPDDREWFVATDVDFWTVYIGGTHELVTDVASRVTTPTEPVSLGHPLVAED